MLRILKLPAFYVPNCSARLLSTTSLLQTYLGETITQTKADIVLSGIPGDPTCGAVTALVDPKNNLPCTIAYDHAAVDQGIQALNAVISEVHQSNINLSEPEKELLRWHYCLGHMGLRCIQFLMFSGVLSHTEATRCLHTAICQLTTMPCCAACQYGKQTLRPSPGTKTTAVRDRQGVLKAEHLLLGQQISVDHYVSSTKGQLFTSRGKTSAESMYSGGCLFVDHASSFVYTVFQTHLNSHETLHARDQFESFCHDHGVIHTFLKSWAIPPAN